MSTQAVRIYEKPHTKDAATDEDGMKYFHIQIAGNDHELAGFLTEAMKNALEGANESARIREELQQYKACVSSQQDELAKFARQHDALRAALESLRKNIDSGLLTALRNGGQLDMDGCEVRVSRQACEEAADHLEQIAALSTLAGKEGK